MTNKTRILTRRPAGTCRLCCMRACIWNKKASIWRYHTMTGTVVSSSNGIKQHGEHAVRYFDSIYAFVGSTKCWHLCFSLLNIIFTTPSATWTLYTGAINLAVNPNFPQPGKLSVENTLHSSPSCQSVGCYPGLLLVFQCFSVFPSNT